MPTRLSELPEGHIVAVDSETSGLYVDDGARVAVVSYAYRDPADQVLVSHALPFDQGVLDLPLGPKEIPKRHLTRMAKWPEWAQKEVVPNLHPDKFGELIKILRRFNLVYHNAKFDQLMLDTGLALRALGLIPCPMDTNLAENFYWDTQIGQHIIDAQYPTGLKPTSVRLGLLRGGEDAEAEALKPWKGPKTDPRYDLIPWAVIKPYAALDAHLTVLLWEYQQARLAEAGWLHALLKRDFETMLTLYEMERRGIGYDAELSAAQATKLKFLRAEVASKLPFRPTPPGAKKFFFADRPPFKGKVTPTGLPKLDEEVQEWLVAQDAPYAKEYRYHEQLKSAESKWYRPWAERTGPDGRLRATFRNTTVVTGRLSAERANLLAIPHHAQMPEVPGLVPVRDLFVPKNGHQLWKVDVSQAEVRVGAAIAECRGLLEGFRNNVDAHSRAAHLIFGVDESDPHWKELRQIGKTLNLSLQYWAGPGRIKDQLEKDTGRSWSLKKVREFRDGWHEAFPEMVQAMELAKEEAETLGYVRLWNDRIRWFAHERGGPREPTFTAFNAKVQGGTAEIMKNIMCRWEYEYPNTLLIQTHDDLLLELPTTESKELAGKCETMMRREFERSMARTWADGVWTVMPFEAEAERFNER